MQRKRVSPFTVVVVAICLSLVGLALFSRLSLRLMPSAEMPNITISFRMPNATSQVVETEVTSVLEAMFSRMNGLNSISSTSGNGYGSINLSLDKNIDIDVARFEASSIVRQTWERLPDGVSYPSLYVRQAESGADRAFLVYTLNSSDDASSIISIVDEVFKTGFSDISEVSGVDISGANNKEWVLTCNTDILESLHVDRSAIVDVLRTYQFDVCVSDFHIRIADADTILDLSDMSVVSRKGEVIPIERLVHVDHYEAAATSYFRVNGLNSIYLTFSAAEDANQIAARNKVVKRIEQLKLLLPSDFEMHKIYDATEHISDELDKIYFRSGLTLLILLLFVWISTFSWRQMVIITICLVVNLFVAIIFYNAFDIGIHVYSLAGITISLNLIIDNAIVMSSHWRRHHNMLAILPIVAATLTTIAALSIIFFLDEELRLKLMDFAAVLIVNLLVSIVVALYLVPALLSLIGEGKDINGKRWMKRFSVKSNRVYLKYIRFIVRYRRWMTVVVILAFGTPIFLLPSKLEGDGRWETLYNETIGSEMYQNVLRPVVDVALGGTLRLFVEHVYEGSYFSEEGEVTLYVNASLPYGSTINQMDALIRRMESYLSTFDEIKQFTTNINSAMRAQIAITFTPEYEYSSFPYVLKSNIISKALQLGGGSWSVYGLPDHGFSNDVREQAGTYRIRLMGYNYDELCMWADSVKKDLLSYKRIKTVEINSRFTHWKDDYTEYVLTPNMEALSRFRLTAQMLFSALNPVFASDQRCNTVWIDNKNENIILKSVQSDRYDVWTLLNMPFVIGQQTFKVGDVCTLVRQTASPIIEKTDQQYRLCLQYEYIGTGKMGQRNMEKVEKKFKALLPLGYTMECYRPQYGWGKNDSKAYLLIGLVVMLILFISSILFNSLRFPFSIIGIIPISFVGLFITFYIFGINFDQGGYAAMILLCGITVNASIYIVNEFLCQKKRCITVSDLYDYQRAFRAKIVPILLTMLSTVLGFLPFMIGSEKESFWYPLAVGTVGGLLLSLIGVVLILPALCLRRKDISKRRKSC